MQPALGDLLSLPVSQRLTLVQELWDSIAESREQLPPQDWQREIVLARLAESASQETLTRDQVWAEVDRRRES